MKKTILYTALLTLVSMTAQADDLSKPLAPPAAATTTIVTTHTPPPVTGAKPSTTIQTQSTTTTITAPAATTPAPATTTTVTTPTITSPLVTTSTPKTTPEINCQYRIPATTTKVEDPLITTWSEKATVQAFEFSPQNIDQQLESLKTCFTDQGWQGFNDALQKSGNINAIKTQNLTVSSQVDGNIQINPIKDNQWKVTVPMQVVYQNDKEKLTQLLSVDLLVGRKVSGDLGIMQMIATPRVQDAATAPAPAPTTTTTTTTTENPTAASPQAATVGQTPAAEPKPVTP